jgi:Protein of unknown function (DUF1549)/Protein of unknown function (DUF1553)
MALRDVGTRGIAVLLMLACAGCGGRGVTKNTAPPKASAVQAKPAPPPKIAEAPVEPPHSRWTILPETAQLGPDDAGLQLVATENLAAGGRADRTRSANWNVEPSGVVEIDSNGYVRPIGPGKAVIRAASADDNAPTCSVTVDSLDKRSWDFATDIVPLFTRAGCNTGGCHGKADGQNGFHLSLFGYDPEGDHAELTHEGGGRRLSIMDPESSLLILKASGQSPHKGGQRIVVGSTEYEALVGWIEAGAPAKSGLVHGALTDVRVEPTGMRLSEPGEMQLRVVARYADGHERDVTRLAGFKSNDDSALTIDPDGRASLSRRAEADLIVRYQSHVVPTRVATIINPDLEFDFANLPRRNLIDEELFKRLADLKVPPSPRSDDATFLRRVSLDLIGQQPRPEEIRAFLDDKDVEKRIKLVDRLMASKFFNDSWLIRLGDLLQISQARFGNTRGTYENWVRRAFANKMPWNEFVTTLLTSLGNPADLEKGGPVNYALEGADPKVQAEVTAQRFLGLRFRCAQCHDHPFDIWTQDDYYGLAAFFAKVGPGAPVPNAGMYMNNEIKVNPDAFVEHLRTKKPADPKLPRGKVVQVEKTEDPRKALASWMTDPENPYFARATANWVWAQFFGRGLAEPADDLSAANPPVHPELLDRLAQDFISSGYDLRHLVRTIVTSEAYGLSSSTVAANEQDRRLFSHQTARPLSAHEIADALAQATDTKLRFDLSRGSGGALVDRKAVEISDPSIPSTLLDTFGRCARANGCSPVSTPQLSLRQSLLLIGGSVIDDRVSQFDGYLSSLLELDPQPSEITETLYLRTLCRKPTEEELSLWNSEFTQATNRREFCEDLFWALLNSREFAFNH